MNIFHYLFSVVYGLNSKYDKLPIKERRLIVLYWLLIITMSTLSIPVAMSFNINDITSINDINKVFSNSLAPMILSFDTYINLLNFFIPISISAIVLIAVFRIPYRMKKLDKYMPVSDYIKKEVERHFFEYLEQFRGNEKIRESGLLREAVISTKPYSSALLSAKHKHLTKKFKKEIDEQICKYVYLVQDEIQISKERASQKTKKESYSKPREETVNLRIPHLKVLGLDHSATAEQIRVAYRKLAMKWHPDRNKDPRAEEKFKMIKSAYENLC